MARLGLNFKISIPKAISDEVRSATGVQIKTTPIHFRKTKYVDSFSSVTSDMDWVVNSFNFSDEEYFANKVRDNITEVSNRTIENLQVEFMNNFEQGKSSWKEVSQQRLARRAAMMNLTGRNILPIDGSDHYTEHIFNDAINNFKAEIRETANKYYIKLGSKFAIKRHCDFFGYKSTYLGPDEISLSILGLNVTAPKGTSSTGKKMIIPTGIDNNNLFFNLNRTSYQRKRKTKEGEKWVTINLGYTQKFDAVISHGKFIYPSKRNPEPQGVPIIFKDKINVKHFDFQKPGSGSERVIFWIQDSAGVLKFPINVSSVLKTSGFIPEDLELGII